MTDRTRTGTTTTTSNDPDALCARPFVLHLGRDCGARLRDALAAVDAATTLDEVYDWDDLRLDHRGRLPDGYRFTEPALKKLCKALSPGLYALLVDVAAWGDPHPDDPASHSLLDAVDIYNRVGRLRFDARLLDRARLVRNARDRTVDGVVGRKFVLLSNLDFLARVEEAIAESGRTMLLDEASLVGRRLVLRHVDRRAAARDPLGGYAHTGVLFANAETGDAPAAATPMVRLATGDLLAEAPGKVRHAGHGVDARLSALLDSGLRPVFSGDRLHKSLARADTGSLARVEPDAGGEAARRGLAGLLERRGVSAGLAARVVTAAVGIRSSDRLSDFPARGTDVTSLMLYSALAAAAKTKHARLREELESTAYRSLFHESENTP